MKKRLGTAVVYVIVIIGLIALKWAFPDPDHQFGSVGFDLLFWAISVIGAYEFMRAVKEISKAQWWTSMITCVLIIPSFVISRMAASAYLDSARSAEIALLVLMSVASVGAMVTASLLVFDFERSSLKSTGYALLCILYCGLLGCVGSNVNHLVVNSLPAVMMIFFITAGADTFAFLIGKLFGKTFPLKLAPHTSPNKTVVGAIGGILGGVVAAVVAYFVCAYVPASPFAPEGYSILTYNGPIHPCLLLVLFSLPTSVFSQLGDLFESAIKRSCDIKDMGKLLPGHGGILDRFDSMLFAAVAIVVCFIFAR